MIWTASRVCAKPVFGKNAEAIAVDPTRSAVRRLTLCDNINLFLSLAVRVSRSRRREGYPPRMSLGWLELSTNTRRMLVERGRGYSVI